MTPEQQRLLEKANRTLQAARVLCYQGFFDSAASRAYYVMFYIANADIEIAETDTLQTIDRAEEMLN
ncbi:MAG: HEPN domain-containing protein, partial [Planktothrix sp.]